MFGRILNLIIFVVVCGIIPLPAVADEYRCIGNLNNAAIVLNTKAKKLLSDDYKLIEFEVAAISNGKQEEVVVFGTILFEDENIMFGLFHGEEFPMKWSEYIGFEFGSFAIDKSRSTFNLYRTTLWSLSKDAREDEITLGGTLNCAVK